MLEDDIVVAVAKNKSLTRLIASVGYKVKSTLPLPCVSATKKRGRPKREALTKAAATKLNNDSASAVEDHDEILAPPHTDDENLTTTSRVYALRAANSSINDKYLRQDPRRVSLSPPSNGGKDDFNCGGSSSSSNDDTHNDSGLTDSSGMLLMNLKFPATAMFEATPCPANDGAQVVRVSPTSLFGSDSVATSSEEVSVDEEEGVTGVTKAAAAKGQAQSAIDEVARAIAIGTGQGKETETYCKLSLLAGMAIESKSRGVFFGLPQMGDEKETLVTPAVTVKVKRGGRSRNPAKTCAESLPTPWIPPNGMELAALSPESTSYSAVLAPYSSQQLQSVARNAFFLINESTAGFQFFTANGSKGSFSSHQTVRVPEQASFKSMAAMTRYIVEDVDRFFVFRNWVLPAVCQAAITKGQSDDNIEVPKFVCLVYGPTMYSRIDLVDGTSDRAMFIRFELPDPCETHGVMPRNFVVSALVEDDGYQLPQDGMLLEQPRYMSMRALN